MPVDYSKWKEIEVSDDEDDTHPNVDTGSLFRWRHQARVERMKEKSEETHSFQARDAENKAKLADLSKKLSSLSTSSSNEKSALEKQKQELDAVRAKLDEEAAELAKKERLEKWNVDTIGTPTWSKTVINKQPKRKKDSEMTNEELAERYKKFVEQNEDKIKKYGMYSRYEDSKQYLQENPHLVCEDTANYLVMYCLELEMYGKSKLMDHVAHQAVVMQFVLELAKQLDLDPRACVNSFFSRIGHADKQYRDAFEEELNAYKGRIRTRAAEKLKELEKEAEEEDREKRLGPGGLDPYEIVETLPEALKHCFVSQNMDTINEALATIPPEWAVYHMNRCVKSGLWVPADPAVFESMPADMPPPTTDPNRKFSKPGKGDVDAGDAEDDDDDDEQFYDVEEPDASEHVVGEKKDTTGSPQSELKS